jgi:hypothetical protein
MKKGGEYWVTERVYFPADFPAVGDHWFMFTEFYNGMGGGVPPLAFYLLGSGTRISFGFGRKADGSGGGASWETPINKGHWHTFLWHVKAHDDPTQGWVEFWYALDNGTPQNINLSGSVQVNGVWRRACSTMLTLWASNGAGLFPNNYRSTEYTTSTGKTVVYFDKMRIGTTRDAVEVTGVSPLVAALP